ncbi:MAG: co-chaperone GroES [Chloroflexi bacterium]|jgi:chaperonin GroES|nr:co-chaperone GroES [Chloroflexota bacterium]
MSVNLKPLGNKVVIEPIDEEEMTASGIILPETAKEKPQKGTVLAVGPGLRLENGERQEMSLKVGDKVLYGKYAGTEVKERDRTLIVIKEDDVLAIIE